MKHLFYSFLTVTAILGTSLSACSMKTDLKQQTADRIARPAFMVDRSIQVENFDIQAWERMHARNDVATIYIEGNGTRQKRSIDIPTTLPHGDATPANPVALHLASRDKSLNVAYLALPCQFIKNPEDKGCARAYWQEKKFSPEVMDAYNDALNDIAARYDITGFNLIGYDNGANIAAVLAARRDDVLSLRTVAGNLNPTLSAENNLLMPLDKNSVFAVDYGSSLSDIPQHHFIGAADEITTPSVYHSYRQRVGLSDCIHYSLIPDADHTSGWVEKWPELLALQPQCAVVHQDLPELPPAADFPGNYHKGM